MKNEKTVDSLLEKYKKMMPYYELCTGKFQEVLNNLITESEIKIHSITSRTKKIDSFSVKVKKELERYKEISDVIDISGVRIICYFSDQVDEVAEIVKNNFTILTELSVDKRQTIDPDKFGYLSLHYVVKLSSERASLPENLRYKDSICEVQIRSILQHAWAEIEHDLGYKSIIEIPKNIRRKFSRLAGLLELADEEFISIKDQLETYAKQIKDSIKTKPKEIDIDKISLKSYFLTSPIVKKTDNEIIKISDWELTDNIRGIEESIKTCDYFGIKTIHELDTILKAESKNIVQFRIEFIRLRGSSELRMPVAIGISLFYLGYILITQKKYRMQILDYLMELNLGGEDLQSHEEFASQLLEMRKNLDKTTQN